MSDDTTIPTLMAPRRSARPGVGERFLRSLASRIREGTLTIEMPDGVRIMHSAGRGPEGVLVIHRWRAIKRFLFQGDIGFADAFIDGDCSSPDLVALIELAARNQTVIEHELRGNFFARLLVRLNHLANLNTKRGSRRNIIAHYDLGNDFYAQWLDPGMSYSSALFSAPGQTLESAQAAKQERALELLDLAPGHAVLEIGCGWGGIIEGLVRRGAGPVVGVTLSPAQLDYARRRVPGADLRLQDYRDTTGSFDRIVSIEMIEAVGREFWPTYFRTLGDRLKSGGIAVLQAITIEASRFEAYCRCPDFIQRYVFPGGMLPTVEVLRQAVARAGLVLTHEERFGQSYARTLAEWASRFEHAWPDIAKLGFEPRFKRLWEYYFAYCEAGFRADNIDVGLYRIEKPAA